MHLKHLEIVQQADYITRTEIEFTIGQYQSIKHYAYILHDKDIDEDGNAVKPHFHIYLHFGGISLDSEMVVKWFNQPHNTMQQIKTTRKKMLQYLIHKNAPSKYQYNPSEVISNMDYLKEIEDDNIVGNFKDYTLEQQIDYIDSISNNPLKNKLYKQLKTSTEFEDFKFKYKRGGERNMRVIFITGESGAGKTTFAKWFAQNKNKPTYISSSSNDLFQDYLMQPLVILDELRPSVMRFDNFLKLTDNNTNSTTQSRYYNKTLRAEWLIITSSIPLNQWYRGEMSSVSSESLRQLYRRITVYAIVDKERKEVRLYNGVDLATGNPQGKYEILKWSYEDAIKKLNTKSAVDEILELRGDKND
jgi:tRNA A37 threonylcarbamoyladenosine biosynthesis protein TsaE